MRSPTPTQGTWVLCPNLWVSQPNGIMMTDQSALAFQADFGYNMGCIPHYAMARDPIRAVATIQKGGAYRRKANRCRS